MPRKRSSRTDQSPASFEPLERRALMSAAVDLTIADADFSDAANQPSPYPNANFFIQPRFNENGLPATHPVPFSIYLSPTPSLTDHSILIYSSPTDTPPTYYASGTLPDTVTPGTWYPVIIVDPNNTIPESDESNNTLLADPVTVAVPPHADLIAPVSYGPDTAPAGSMIDISSYLNVLPFMTKVAYTLSSDAIAGNADDIPIDTASIGQLAWHPGGYHGTAPAAAITSTHSFTLPANVPPGQYHLVTTADPDNTIPEPDETNNATLGTLITILPADTLDLTAWPPHVQYPTHAIPGSHIGVGAYPFSTFGQPVHPKIAIVLSSDNTYGNGDDILLGSYDADALTPPPFGIVVDYSNPPTLEVTLPPTLTPGHYKLFAVVDPDNQIAEYDESNNVSPPIDLTIQSPPLISTMPVPDPPTPTVPLFPDPVITPPSPAPPVTSTPSPSQPNLASLAAAPTFRNVTPRSTLRTPVTLTNPTGRRRTGTYKVTLYLSADDHLSRNDKPFSTQTLTATLRPHQTKTRRLAYRLPPSANPGRRYVFATVTPIHPTRITAPLSLAPTPLNILTKPLHHSRPISKQLLDSHQPQP